MGESVVLSDTDDEYDYTHVDTPDVEGYTVPASIDANRDADIDARTDDHLGFGRSPTLESAVGELRVSDRLALARTFSNSSSQYAESEGGSDFGMADSLTLPPAPPSTWSDTFASGPIDLGAPPAPAAAAATGLPSAAMPRRAAPVGAAAAGRTSWQDKPTFFEYLYGA